MEAAGLPFAPIRKPEDLYDDEHLLATGGLADVRLPDGPKAGQTVKTTCSRSRWTGSDWVCGWIRRAWESTAAICWPAVGYAEADIDELLARAIVA